MSFPAIMTFLNRPVYPRVNRLSLLSRKQILFSFFAGTASLEMNIAGGAPIPPIGFIWWEWTQLLPAIGGDASQGSILPGSAKTSNATKI